MNLGKPLPLARSGPGKPAELDEIAIEEIEKRSVEAIGARTRSRSINVVCTMMQKNERALLDPWIRYHSYLFGAENLHIFDNGSTNPAVIARLRQAEAEGCVVHWEYTDREHFESKGKVMRRVVMGMEKKGNAAPDGEPRAGYDFFMPLDCDEFVGYMGHDGKVECDPNSIANYLNAKLRGDPRVLVIRGSYFNVPERPGMYYFRNERKCFFTTGAVRDLGMGFHQATSRLSDKEVTTSIVHFHYRHKPYAMFNVDARQKLEGRMKDLDADTVKNFTGKGRHMVRYMEMSEEEYASHFDKFDRVPLTSLANAFKRLGLELPY